MSDVINLTEEELTELNDLKENIQKNIFELGELYLEKMEIDGLYKNLSEKESSLRENVETFKVRESSLINKILEKYGEGSLNPLNGTFIPTKKTTQ
jgi:hypothetical protein